MTELYIDKVNIWISIFLFHPVKSGYWIILVFVGYYSVGKATLKKNPQVVIFIPAKQQLFYLLEKCRFSKKS